MFQSDWHSFNGQTMDVSGTLLIVVGLFLLNILQHIRTESWQIKELVAPFSNSLTTFSRRLKSCQRCMWKSLLTWDILVHSNLLKSKSAGRSVRDKTAETQSFVSLCVTLGKQLCGHWVTMQNSCLWVDNSTTASRSMAAQYEEVTLNLQNGNWKAVVNGDFFQPSFHLFNNEVHYSAVRKLSFL